MVFAQITFDAATGAVILTRQQPVPGPTARLPSGDEVRVGDTTLSLDPPAGFIPFLRLDSALSAEGERIAILARRFSGPGEVRAAIRIHDLATGRLLAAHDSDSDLLSVPFPGAARVYCPEYFSRICRPVWIPSRRDSVASQASASALPSRSTRMR